MFQTPKVYDPSLATASLATRPTPQRESSKASAASQKVRAQDFGFDADVELEDKNKELLEQIDSLRARTNELQVAVVSAKDSESLVTRKLQSFQQVNRSQNTLMRAELQKCRRRLSHTQEVAKRLQKQAAWFQENSPVLSLPTELQGLPREDEDGDETAELAQQHQRWESDVATLHAMIQADLVNAGSVAGHVSADSEASTQRVAELTTLVKRHKNTAEEQAKEVEQLRRELAERPHTVAAHSPAAGTQAAMAVMDSASLRQDLESKEKENKDQQKKLKQLATAYKQLDANKKDLDARLTQSEKSLADAKAEAARPQKSPLNLELVGRVRSQLASERAQIAELRESVTASFQQQLPRQLQELMEQQMPRLQHLVNSGAEQWKEKYLLESDRRRKLHNLVQEMKGNIRVYCRVRPLNATESGTCIKYPDSDEIQIVNPELGVKKAWQFNEIFDESATQAQLFAGINDLVVSMLDGYNVCIFAYGQTGSGKTHSMQGTSANPGIYQRTFDALFKVAVERQSTSIELKGSIVEIYNEEIRDLIPDKSEAKVKLQVKMGKEGNHVPGLMQRTVTSTQDVEALLAQGQSNRSTAATDMNLHSSRSHLLVQIFGTMTTTDGKTKTSSITLVDLAGSERLAKSGVTGDRAKEAIAINKSLSALGDCINARATKSSHTPFRNSTLTHLLQDSLSGDSKTLMLLQINPCKDYVEESLCSLQFGARVNAVEMSSGKK